MSGLLDMIGMKYLEENDVILFTSCGAGKFEITLFDNAKVEKSLNYNLIESGMFLVCNSVLCCKLNSIGLI